MRFEPYFDKARFDPSANIFEVIAKQKDPETRRDSLRWWFGSAMDTVRRFLPKGVGDRSGLDGGNVHRWVRRRSMDPRFGNLDAVSLPAAQPGRGERSNPALCRAGGIGSLSSALQRAPNQWCRSASEHRVKSIDLVNGTATGVTLRDGTQISADIVLSSLDPHTTFRELIGDEHLPGDYIRKLKEINYDPAICRHT